MGGKGSLRSDPLPWPLSLSEIEAEFELGYVVKHWIAPIVNPIPKRPINGSSWWIAWTAVAVWFTNDRDFHIEVSRLRYVYVYPIWIPGTEVNPIAEDLRRVNIVCSWIA